MQSVVNTKYTTHLLTAEYEGASNKKYPKNCTKIVSYFCLCNPSIKEPHMRKNFIFLAYVRGMLHSLLL